MEILSNRELAGIIIAAPAVILILFLLVKEKSLANLVKIFFSSKYLWGFSITYVFICGISAFYLYQLNILTLYSAYEMIVIFLAGFVFIFNLKEKRSILKLDNKYYIKSTLSVVSFTAIFVVFMNLYSFPLWFEIVLGILLFLIILIKSVVPEPRIVQKSANVIIIISVTGALFYSASSAYISYQTGELGKDITELTNELILSFYFSIIISMLGYLIAIFTHYNRMIRTHIDGQIFNIRRGEVASKLKRKIILYCGFNLNRWIKISPYVVSEFVRAKTRQDVDVIWGKLKQRDFSPAR